MSTWLQAVSRFHQLCLRHLIYPLILSSAFVVGIFVGRIRLSHSPTFGFFMWNLILAWLPYFFSLYALYWHRRQRGRWTLLLIPVVLWLIFFPNAPYVITDLVHLDERPNVPFWYDIGFFASYAWTGLFLAVASLSTMQKIARDYFGRIGGWLFALGAIGLSGLGIYVGRFIGWNSWDLIVQPFEVLTDVVERFAHPLRNPQPFGVTMMFAAFVFVCYVTFVSFPHRERQ